MTVVHKQKTEAVEVVLDLDENPRRDEIIDCSAIEVNSENCDLENCKGCILNQNDEKTCLECTAGYHVNSKGFCQENTKSNNNFFEICWFLFN